MTGYLDIVSWIVDGINEGDFPPGSLLPSERTLAERFHVARGTVSRATLELRHRGMIESHQGRGHIVTGSPFTDIEPKPDYL